MVPEGKIPAVAYMRCSGEAQIEGDTWARQEAAITKYADGAGFLVVRWFRDEAVPGKTELEDRAGLSECMALVREHNIGTVLVESADRLARDLIVSELIVRDMQRAGVRIVTAGGVDLTEGSSLNPTAKLIRQILACIAEYEKNTIVLRMRAAKDRKRARGERVEGQKPFGSLAGEAEALAIMAKGRQTGRSFEAIALHLNTSGLNTRSGAQWRASTIQKILARR